MTTEIVHEGLVKNDASLTHRQDYYQKNRGKILERQKRYYESNKEKAKTYYEQNREKISEYYQANRDRALEYKKSYRELNKESISEKNKSYKKAKSLNKEEKSVNIVRKSAAERMAVKKEWRKNNPGKVSSAAKAWRQANHDKTSHYHRTRRARKRNAEGSHTAADIQQLLVLQKGKCAVCHASIANGYHVDHVMPLALGGTNDRSSLQLLCPSCNMSKNAKHPIDFMQSRGMLL